MKRLLIIPLAIILILTSCLHTQKSPNNGVAENPTISKLKSQPADTLVFLERSPCFGFCPTYNYTVNTHGQILYRAIKNVDSIGIFTSQLSNSDFEALIALIDKSNYFLLPHKFPTGDVVVYDLPSTHTVIKLEGKRNSVLNNNYEDNRNKLGVYALTSLQKFESSLDSLILKQEFKLSLKSDN